MSKTLILSFNSAVAKYSRLSKKVRKSMSKGEFWRYTRRKRHHLLNKIERLKRRISELRLQLKLASAGLATGLLMAAAGDVSAQKTPVGPFVENPVENPFPRPAFTTVPDPDIVFADLDNDGDLDATQGNARYGSQYMLFYKNLSVENNTNEPIFESWDKDGLFVEFFGSYVNPGRPAYADIDDDGDLDMVIGMGYSDNGPNDVEDDVVYLFRNIGSAEDPIFERDFSDSHPFYNMRIRSQGWPAFTDFDKDGDMDFILMGYYYDNNDEAMARLQFFRNDKVGHGAGTDVFYTQLEGTKNNPLYVGAEPGNAFFSAEFADLDGDGDEDFFLTNNGGQISYKRNDNGVFVDQEGEFTFHASGTSTGNPLDIDNIGPLGVDFYKSLSFGDLDGDGDTDLVFGTNSIGTFNSPYIYVENTGNGVLVADRSFTNRISGFSMGYNANSVFFDHDNDGDLDVLLTGQIYEPGIEGSEDPFVVHLYFENNEGDFEEKILLDDPFQTLPNRPGYGELKMIDIDGDGDLDGLFVTNEYNPTLYHDVTHIEYIKNDGGTFKPIAESANPFKDINSIQEYSYGFDIGDLNGDGLPDMVLLGGFTTPRFYKNTGTVGNAAFADESGWSTGLSTEIGNYNPKLVDIDNDGDNDMVIGKYFYIWYYENIGDSETPEWIEYQQHFENENLQNPFGDVYSFSFGRPLPTLGDADGDGDKDLLFAKDSDPYFTYYENQNPAPNVVFGGSTALNFVAGQPVNLGTGMTIADPDKDRIFKITAQITPYQQGQEKITLNGTHGDLAAQWDDVHGILSITGDDTITVFQEALNSLVYEFTGPSSGRVSGGRKGKHGNGRQVQKTVSVYTLDSDLTIAPSNTTTFIISGDDGNEGSSPVIDARPKTAAAKGNIALSIKPFITDLDDDLDLSTLVVTSEQGATVTVANGIITVDYSTIPDFEGTDVITVSVCDMTGACVTDSFTVEVGAVPRIYTGMSPNGDEINDHFHIDYIPNGTHVAIYNRWGDIIYEETDYNPFDSSKRFEGRNKNGTEVTAGSYFFKVKFPNSGKAETGSLLLNR